MVGFSTFILAVATGLLLVATPVTVSAIDADTLQEVRRIDQRISDMNSKMERILRDIRGIERKIEQASKDSKVSLETSEETADILTTIQNTDIANLIAVDKQIAQRMNALAKHVEEQTPTWNWGSESRSCEDVGKHQQIQSVRSADGQFTLRYLCFDGRAIHLGTEVNLPPQ